MSNPDPLDQLRRALADTPTLHADVASFTSLDARTVRAFVEDGPVCLTNYTAL